MKNEEENLNTGLINDKTPKDKNIDIDNETGYYKKAYSELIYKTLYQIFRGEEVEEETNWSKLLKKQLDYALKSKIPTPANLLLQFAIKAVPARIYEKTNIETKEIDEEELKDMLDMKNE